jgi:hypothetical protein
MLSGRFPGVDGSNDHRQTDKLQWSFDAIGVVGGEQRLHPLYNLQIDSIEANDQVISVLRSRYCTNMEREKVKIRYKIAQTNQSSNG